MNIREKLKDKKRIVVKIGLTPGLFQRRMLYWHRFAPESRMMRKVTDALLDYGHKVLRQD